VGLLEAVLAGLEGHPVMELDTIEKAALAVVFVWWVYEQHKLRDWRVAKLSIMLRFWSGAMALWWALRAFDLSWPYSGSIGRGLLLGVLITAGLLIRLRRQLNHIPPPPA
jgi:peptidoglycan biosynthesis protein MviN/MurJ (putative lipid II flippase)